jgi:hypothetical protein
MEEETGDKVESIEYHSILKEFIDVFGEIPGFPPRRDIEFSIYLVSGVTSMFKTPCSMGTLELKEL